MKKRTSFTLLELVIALPLLALLSSFFLFSLKSFSLQRQKQELALKEVKESFYFKYRLRKMLLSLPESQRNLQIENGKMSFFSDNGIHLNPEASNKVSTYLLHKDKRLCIQVRHFEDESFLIREEEYFKNVQSLEYFWGSYEENGWCYEKTKPKDKEPLSLMIKIQMENPKKKKKETFIFAL